MPKYYKPSLPVKYPILLGHRQTRRSLTSPYNFNHITGSHLQVQHVTNNLLHIVNNDGKKERIDTLLKKTQSNGEAHSPMK